MFNWRNLCLSFYALESQTDAWTDLKGPYAEMTIVESSKPTWTDPKGPYAEMTIVES